MKAEMSKNKAEELLPILLGFRRVRVPPILTQVNGLSEKQALVLKAENRFSKGRVLESCPVETLLLGSGKVRETETRNSTLTESNVDAPLKESDETRVYHLCFPRMIFTREVPPLGVQDGTEIYHKAGPEAEDGALLEEVVQGRRTTRLRTEGLTNKKTLVLETCPTGSKSEASLAKADQELQTMYLNQEEIHQWKDVLRSGPLLLASQDAVIQRKNTDLKLSLMKLR